MTVAELVGRALAGFGADHVFGVVGSGNFHVTNAMVAAGARFVAARHEGGAATMADAYARTSGTLGVLSVHQGCGLTNAMTGITEAAKSRTPMIVLAADTAGAAVRSNFRVDQDGLATAVGAVSERVYGPATAIDDVVRACRRAVEGRRTVVLNLPLDVQAAPASGADVPAILPPQVANPDPAAVEALARVLLTAQRPVFIAGRGARHARAELRRLASTCGALLATSAVVNGLFAGDPWSLGISGGFATPLAAELIGSADLIVGWGASLNMWTMRHGALIAPDATVVQVDLEPDAIGAHRPVDLGVVGDVARTAEALVDLVASADGYRQPAIRERIATEGRWRDVRHDDVSTVDRIDPRTLSIALDDVLPDERVVAVDSGNFMGYPAAYLSVPDERGFCFTQAYQSIGLGLATAIGAALAQPQRLPVAALGDGGALMSIAEVDTVVRLGLPMAIVIYNDEAYGAEVHHFGPHGYNLDTVVFPETDIAAIGRGFGADGITVRKPSDVDDLRDWLAGPRDGPIVVDAKVTSGPSWWLEEAFKGH
ncbi:thiamine pyrophosphate-binding protein [Fodinicola acaciae]|uniref:thiamine pyrophosphate-binding protein n=1 Tax=Fodinicola acaciae TaxID=2681555 RepID=UPI0013D8A2F9|nr:thiamine pyrophosphate-binding protein [Fodinicola acaciae]